MSKFTPKRTLGPITREASVCGVTYVDCVATYAPGQTQNITINKSNYLLDKFVNENSDKPLGEIYEQLEDLFDDVAADRMAESHID